MGLSNKGDFMAFDLTKCPNIFRPTRGTTTTRVISGVECKSTVNYDHYGKVYKTRKAEGTLIDDDHGNIPNHPLVGKQFHDSETNKTYNIEKVLKHWYGGYYLALLIEKNQSHALRYWENISTDNEIVLEAIENNKKTCRIIY
jgi:hypothetical protein